MLSPLKSPFLDPLSGYFEKSIPRSAIVTGCKPWTIYQYDNYQGYSACLFPADTTNCYPSFYPTPDNLGGLSDQVSSVRKGCFSKNRIEGRALQPGERLN